MAETNGLLNRRTGKSGTEGSNPSVSANMWPCQKKRAKPCRKNEKALRVFRPLRPLTRSVLVPMPVVINNAVTSPSMSAVCQQIFEQIRHHAFAISAPKSH